MLVGRLRDGRVTVFCFVFRVWSLAGVAHHGVAKPLDAVSVATRACLAGQVLAGLRVVCLRSSRGCSCGVVGARLSWPPHGWLGLRGYRRAAVRGCIVEFPRRCWLVVSWFVQVWCSVGC